MKKLFTLFALLAMFLFAGCEVLGGDSVTPDDNQTEQPNDKPDDGNGSTENPDEGEKPDGGDGYGNPDDGGENPDLVTPPNNQIWYTSTDGEIVTPNDSDVFGANIVSNTYENNKGVIECDGDITIISGAFSHQDNLESVVLPNSVATIEGREGGGAFVNCPNLVKFSGKYASEDGRCLIVDGTLVAFAPAELTDYVIPDDVTVIDDVGIFSYCFRLQNIVIPSSVVKIGSGAFVACIGLVSVDIPEGVKSIGASAFFSCSGMTTISIPESVTSIGEWAFTSCESLESVYCKPTTPPNVGQYMFEHNSGFYIYVPKESVNAYKSADGWSEYADAIEPCVFE